MVNPAERRADARDTVDTMPPTTADLLNNLHDLNLLKAAIGPKGDLDALLPLGAPAAAALAALLDDPHTAAPDRERALNALAAFGPVAAQEAADALLRALTDKAPALRKAALQALAQIGGDLDPYRDALLNALLKAEPDAPAAAARWEADAAPLAREVFDRAKPFSKPWRAAADLLLAIAPHVQTADFEAELLALLTHDKETWQKLGLAITAQIQRPTLDLVEPVADLSYLPDARHALRRFPFERVKRELRSLINSSSPPERLVGLELARYYGAAAQEFAELIAQKLPYDLTDSARAAVHALGRLLPDEELANALQPALDHPSEEVRSAARSYLEDLDVPIRESAWEDHPFSPSLRIVLQRLGFKPKLAFKDIPRDVPLPDRPFLWGERTPDDDKARLSRTMWALLYGLTPPPYTLYTVWDSYESSHTFYFSSEEPIYVVKYGPNRHLAHVFGDGSIGNFATLNLLDTSNDPALYYTERWGPTWSDGHWRASYSLSSYLRQLGKRS